MSIKLASYLSEEYCHQVGILYPEIETIYKENPYFLLDIEDELPANKIDKFPDYIEIDKHTILKTFELRKIEIKELLLYVLKQNEQLGNSWMCMQDLIQQCNKILAKTGHPLLKGSLKQYINYYNDLFALSRDKKYISLYKTKQKEFYIYNGIKKLKNMTNEYNSFEAKDETNRLSNEQLNSANNVVRLGGNITLLTGGPGTGKTTITKSIVKGLNESFPNKKIVLLAPTGKAANRIQEVFYGQDVEIKTIHLFVGWNFPKPKMKTVLRDIKDTDFIIIDEASMISVDVLSLLFKYIDIYKTKILFIGDENQLPAIGTGDTIRDLRQMNVYEEHLNINYRSSMAINTNATSLLNGDNTIKTDDTFEFIDIEKDIDNKENVMEIISKEVINSDNDTIVLSPYRKKEIKGNIVELNNTIHKNIFGDIRKDFFNGWCIGDKVILVKTNYKRKYFNGDTGIITGYKRNAITVNKEKQDAYIVTLSNGNNVYVVDENDIELAYSITIHKAQGSEYDEVNIYIPQYSPFISKELLYTAITRAKNKVRLWTTKEIYDLVCKTESVRRNTLIGLWNKDNLSQVI